MCLKVGKILFVVSLSKLIKNSRYQYMIPALSHSSGRVDAYRDLDP